MKNIIKWFSNNYILVNMKINNHIIVLFIILIVSCTSGSYEEIHDHSRVPYIDPDYMGVAVPPNIAPLNFVIKEPGTSLKS